MITGLIIIETRADVNEDLFADYTKLGAGIYIKATDPDKIFKVTDEQTFLEFFDHEILTELTEAIIRLIAIQDYKQHYIVAIKYGDTWDVNVYSTNKKFLLYRKDGFYIPFNSVDELYNNLDNWRPLNKDEKLPGPNWVLTLDGDSDLYILTNDVNEILRRIEELAEQGFFKLNLEKY